MNFLMQLPKDKLGHALAGLIIFKGKEVYDYFHRDKHTPDFLDFVATISVPIVLTILIYLKGGIYA